jgi:thymidylate synthase (FAD)
MNNTVILLGHYGSDETHALSAWTSTSRELTDEKRARIPALLSRLAADGHHTPFEKSTLHFLVQTDIATHIHLLKHRIGVSINAESARYRELGDDYYQPDDLPANLDLIIGHHAKKSLRLYHELVEALEKEGVTRARAKESARLVLPYAKQIRADISFNWRSFHHFLGLRLSPHAQVEVRDVARQMLALVAGIDGAPFSATIDAFGWAKETINET